MDSHQLKSCNYMWFKSTTKILQKMIEFSLDAVFYKVSNTLSKCSLYFKCIFNIGTVVVNCSCTKLLQCAPDMKVWGSENRGKTFKVSKVPKQKV